MFTTIIVIFLLIIIGIPLIFFFLSRDQSKKINENGEKIKAKIVKIVKEPLYRYNTKSSSYNSIVFKIIAEANINGETKEFISERIYPENLSEKVGDSVFIYVDRKTTNRYFVDIEQ